MLDVKEVPGHRCDSVLVLVIASVLCSMAPASALAIGRRQDTVASSMQSSRPSLTARVSRWQGEPVKKRKGPKGFDLAFRLVGARFDGTFGIEGVPQQVPEGEAFDAQIKLTNLGSKKSLSVSSVSVTGDGVTLNSEILVKQVDPKTAQPIAGFKVPPQSSVGSSFVITVVLSNGDRHKATLTFAPAS